MGRNSRSGGQHSDEARPSSYQVTHRPAGARPQPATVLVEGTKPAQTRVSRPGTSATILSDQATPPSSLHKHDTDPEISPDLCNSGARISRA